MPGRDDQSPATSDQPPATSDQPRTAFSVITGFLGAGKTTLLRRLLRADWKDRRLAFIINDLAEMDVDGQILSSETAGDLSITRLSSGCVCCTIKGEFEQTVDQLLSTLHPDALIVESSGVANPAAVLHGLHHPDLRLDAVVCVIDAERFAQYARLSAAVEWQVYMADFVLINKAELAAPAQLDDAEKRVRKFNARAAILRTSYCDVSPDVLFGAQPAHAGRDIQALVDDVQHRLHAHTSVDVDAAPADSASEFHFHDHLTEDRIDSFAVRLGRPLDEGRLTEFLKSPLLQDVYRAKGFVRLSDAEGLRLFNFVPRRFSTEALPQGGRQPGDAFVIFIGKHIQARQADIARGLRDCQA
jgi:G3E family GTPase